ncbi:Twinfilin [Drechmeria coniospora]|uniref:Twinfilin n=1 Tax=Drechmeria coniospora TaxID=98403 RepID=A0A151GHE4_DRECN|nr:Twinfilin [Drechmeria coniospora]KYK56489.1 Twinfilin [Drechmeria coniospora]
MQSGISASEELQAQFNSLLSSTSDFALVITIEREALVPVATLPAKSSSFVDNLPSIQEHLKPNAALYMIIRRYDTAPRFVAVTYVPDAAPVRQKMLFASTRLTLARELGTEHFRETIFTTTTEELSEAGFKKLDAHNQLEAPLTKVERTLGEVKRAEQEAGAGTATKEIHLSKSLTMPVAEDAIAAMRDVGQDGGRLVTMLKINGETEVVELVAESPKPASIGELSRAISSTEPRFTFYRFTHTHDGREESPVLFFYTCPAAEGSKSIKKRMMYPLMKRAVLTIAATEAGLTLAKKFEVEEPSEITEQMVLDDLHPKAAARQGFSRPKRPGR